MKRSTALKVIRDALVKNYEDEGIETSLISHDILDYLEELGMLPPATTKIIEIDKNLYITKETNEWDEE